MSHVNLLEPNAATGTAGEHLAQIKGAFGMVPNMFKAVANSPAALASMWGSFGALSQGRLGAKLGEQIAVAVADRNNCNYCLAAHTVLGRKAGASAAEMTAAQQGQSNDPKTAAILAFVQKVVEKRAEVSAADVQALRKAGLDDQDIVEVMAHIALNLFTNYVNVGFDVPVDFPAVKLSRAA